jgi:hypothetical protein
VKQWPSEGTYIALASPVFPSSTVVHIAAHPVDLNENAFMNYILEQYASGPEPMEDFFRRAIV